MLDYDRRLNDAWDKVPSQYQKQILEDLEHKAYCQDFSQYKYNTPEQEHTSTNSTSCEYNPLELVADVIIILGRAGWKYLGDCAEGVGIITRAIKREMKSK